MELFSIQILLLIFIISLCVYISTRPISKVKGNSALKTYPLLRDLPELLQNRHRFHDWATDVLSRCPTQTTIFRRPGDVNGVMTANPLNVEHMLKTNFENYPKGDRFMEILGDFLGRGIFNADGELWKVQRKTASYEFSTKSLRNFVVDTVTAETKTRLIPFLRKAAETKRVVDIQDVLERYAFDNLCRVAFNVDPGCLGGDGTADSGFMRAFDEAANISSGRFLTALPILFRIKRFFKLGSERRLAKSVATVHQFADKIIKARLKEKAEKKDEDLLSRFIRTDEMSKDLLLLRDVVISFILAGRDTTSSALTWFFWQLSSKPEVKKNILAELQTVRVRNGTRTGDTYSFEELREMNYLHAALSEILRLYPPVPADTKLSLNDDVMPDGTFVGKNWFVSYHAYAMGRMESIWGSDCREFKPARWIESETGVCKQESQFRFPVFHAGPRLCLGKDMAYIQMKSIAASVLEKFEFDIQPSHKNPDYTISLTLRMKGGLPVKVRERSAV